MLSTQSGRSGEGQTRAPPVVVSVPTPPIIGQYVPALIVIDVQHDFVHGKLKVPDAESVIQPINDLINLPFAMRVATRDYHPGDNDASAPTHHKPPFSRLRAIGANTTSILEPSLTRSSPLPQTSPLPEGDSSSSGANAPTTTSKPTDTAPVTDTEQTLWPIHCAEYTGGADFVRGLQVSRFDQVLHKGTHPHIESYSAFRDMWCEGPSDLPALLQARGVTDVYFVGIAGDYSLKYSAMDAVDFGYTTWVVRDAVRCLEEDLLAEDELKWKGAEFTTIGEVTKKLNAEAEKQRNQVPEPSAVD